MQNVSMKNNLLAHRRPWTLRVVSSVEDISEVTHCSQTVTWTWDPNLSFLSNLVWKWCVHRHTNDRRERQKGPRCWLDRHNWIKFPLGQTWTESNLDSNRIKCSEQCCAVNRNKFPLGWTQACLQHVCIRHVHWQMLHCAWRTGTFQCLEECWCEVKWGVDVNSKLEIMRLN